MTPKKYRKSSGIQGSFEPRSPSLAYLGESDFKTPCLIILLSNLSAWSGRALEPSYRWHSPELLGRPQTPWLRVSTYPVPASRDLIMKNIALAPFPLKDLSGKGDYKNCNRNRR
jgi:hypothetical protein